MDDTRAPLSGLKKIGLLMDALGSAKSRTVLDELGEELRDFTVAGNSIPRRMQDRLETMLDEISDTAMAGSGIVRGYITLALQARYESRRADTIPLTFRALEWAKKSNDKVLLARVFKFLSCFNGEIGNFVEALHYSLKGLAALATCSERQYEMELLSAVGDVLVWNGQHRSAVSVYRRALELTTTIDATTHAIVAIHNNMAACYLTLGEYRRGLDSSSAAMRLLGESGTATGGVLDLELVSYYAARLLMETGQFVEAGQCLALARCADIALFAPMIRLAEGMLMIYEGKTDAGLALVDSAAADAVQRSPYTSAIETTLAAARAYELAGRPDGARARIAKAIEHTLTLRRRGTSTDFEDARRIIDVTDADSLEYLVSRVPCRSNTASEAMTRRKLQNMAVLAEMPEYPCARHAFRVGRLSYLLAREIGLSESKADEMSLAGCLHDIGKIGVPRQLLAKSVPLSDIELEAVRTHTRHGEDLLRGYGGAAYDLAIEAARAHHERWDGNGYPDGLSGDQIPLAARIVSIAESFDAMTHERPWRKAMPIAAALSDIRSESGRQFDPALVSPFIGCVEQAMRAGADLDALLSEEAQGSDLVALQARLDAAVRAVAR